MEPDIERINYEYNKKEIKKNVKEYQDKFFKKIERKRKK